MSDESTRELEAVAKALCSLLDVPPTQGNVFVIADEIGRRTARIADLERQLAEAREADSATAIDAEGVEAAAEAGWNACRRQVYLLSQDYVEQTHPLKNTVSVEGNFYRGQYDVAKSFAKAFSSFEARDCDYFKQIDFAAIRAMKQEAGE